MDSIETFCNDSSIKCCLYISGLVMAVKIPNALPRMPSQPNIIPPMRTEKQQQQLSVCRQPIFSPLKIKSVQFHKNDFYICLNLSLAAPIECTTESEAHNEVVSHNYREISIGAWRNTFITHQITTNNAVFIYFFCFTAFRNFIRTSSRFNQEEKCMNLNLTCVNEKIWYTTFCSYTLMRKKNEIRRNCLRKIVFYGSEWSSCNMRDSLAKQLITFSHPLSFECVRSSEHWHPKIVYSTPMKRCAKVKLI